MADPFRVPGANVTCPRCGRAFAAEVQVVADTAREPELRAAAEAGRLNQVVCPHCEHEFVAPVPLLYHDPERALALAYVPAVLEDDAQDIVSGLLARYVQGSGGGMPPEELLDPRVCTEPDELAVLARGGEPEVGRADLAEAVEWVRRHGANDVVQALEALEGVGDLSRLLVVLNQTPGLVEPATVRTMDQLAEAADERGREGVAEVLRDVAGVLRLHTPPSDEEEEEVAEEVREAIGRGDLERATLFLDQPLPPEDEDARRALLTGLDADKSEGFDEHARVFSGLLESMLHDESAPLPELPSGAAFQELIEFEGMPELLRAPTVDEAGEVLETNPRLISREAVALLRRAEAEARDQGQEARANALDAVISTIYVFAEDEDELEEGETTDEP